MQLCICGHGVHDSNMGWHGWGGEATSARAAFSRMASLAYYKRVGQLIVG